MKGFWTGAAIAVMGAATLTSAGAGAAPDAAASPKYSAPINVAKATIIFRATATYSDGTSADRLYGVRLDADSDGDGQSDEAWLRVRCDSSISTAIYAYTVKSPRDAATGQSSGKRMHKPFVIIKEWGPSTPQFRAIGGGKAAGTTVGWDLATNKGSRSAGWNIKEAKGARAAHGGESDASAGGGADDKTMAMDDWHQVTLTDGAPNLCS